MDIEGIPEGETGDFDDPLTNRLMTGDMSAVGKMSEDINKYLSTVQEVVMKTRDLREKTSLERPGD